MSGSIQITGGHGVANGAEGAGAAGVYLWVIGGVCGLETAVSKDVGSGGGGYCFSSQEMQK